MTPEQVRERLLALLVERSYAEREVTLASGRKSNFYIDCRETALHHVRYEQNTENAGRHSRASRRQHQHRPVHFYSETPKQLCLVRYMSCC